MEDCISRKEARNALLNKGQHSTRYKLGQTWELNLYEIEEVLNALPSVKPTREKSEWIPQIGGYVMCNNCFSYLASRWNFCPICGSDMRGEEE